MPSIDPVDHPSFDRFVAIIAALRATCGKFRRRWAYMESAAQVDGRSVEELAAEEREALWEEAKKNC